MLRQNLQSLKIYLRLKGTKAALVLLVFNMKKYKRIFLDVDGVLADFVTRLLKNYNMENDTDFKYDDVIDWNFKGIISDNDTYKNYVDAKFWLMLEPFFWAEDLVRAAHSTGAQIAFLTYLGSEPGLGWQQRKQWLEKNFPYIDNVGDRLINTRSKNLVVTKGDLLIDDSEFNVTAALKSGADVITLAQPWNLGCPNRMPPQEIIEKLLDKNNDFQLDLFGNE